MSVDIPNSLKEMQTLATIQGQQYQAVLESLRELDLKAKNQHQDWMEKMKMLDEYQQAVLNLAQEMKSAISDQQDVTLALINMIEIQDQRNHPNTSIPQSKP